MAQSISTKTGFELYRHLVTSQILDFPGSVFYHPQFLQIAADILNLELRPAAFFMDDRLVGIANFMLNRRYGVNNYLIPKLFQYYGPATLDENIDLLPAVNSYFKGEADSVLMSLLPWEINRPNYQGWHTYQRLTYCLPPNSFENLRQNCFDDVKNKLNKASKAGLEFASSVDFSDEIYTIYEASFSRQRLKPPLKRPSLLNWVHSLTAYGLAFTGVAQQKGIPVAFRTQLIYGKYSYDWLAGALPEANQTGANQFLVLKIGEHLFNKGIANWDLLGGDIKSIGDFKRSFGSIPKPHIQLEKNYSLKGRIYRMLMKFKGRYRG